MTSYKVVFFFFLKNKLTPFFVLSLLLLIVKKQSKTNDKLSTIMLRGKRQLGKETKNWLQFIFDNNKNT